MDAARTYWVLPIGQVATVNVNGSLTTVFPGDVLMDDGENRAVTKARDFEAMPTTHEKVDNRGDWEIWEPKAPA